MDQKQRRMARRIPGPLGADLEDGELDAVGRGSNEARLVAEGVRGRAQPRIVDGSSDAAARSPLPRPIKPEEVADATVFLCSHLASGVTGHVLYVDCGYNVMAV